MLSVPPRRPREIRTSSQGSRDCVEEVSNDLWRYTIKNAPFKGPICPYFIISTGAGLTSVLQRFQSPHEPRYRSFINLNHKVMLMVKMHVQFIISALVV